MLFKVSFKEDKKNPSKVIEKAGGTTIVTLKGVVNLPEFWYNIPKEIHTWIAKRTKVEIYEDIANNTLIIFSQGISRCMEGDRYDSLLFSYCDDGEKKNDSSAEVHSSPVGGHCL